MLKRWATRGSWCLTYFKGSKIWAHSTQLTFTGVRHVIWDSFYLHQLTLILSCIHNNIHYKVWDEIIYPYWVQGRFMSIIGAFGGKSSWYYPPNQVTVIHLKSRCKEMEWTLEYAFVVSFSKLLNKHSLVASDLRCLNVMHFSPGPWWCICTEKYIMKIFIQISQQCVPKAICIGFGNGYPLHRLMITQHIDTYIGHQASVTEKTSCPQYSVTTTKTYKNLLVSYGMYLYPRGECCIPATHLRLIPIV